MIEVSVIIPTYNREATLSRALDSVFDQEGVVFEVLVIDDGSTDNTEALIKEKYPSVIYHAFPNQGPAAARNRGIQKARGKWIAFLDSDDVWLTGKLQAQLRFFQEHPDYLICQTEEIWIRNGKRVNPMKKHQKYGGLIFEQCLPLCIVSPSAVMVHPSLFDAEGLFDESFPACEDYELWLRLAAHHPIGYIKKPYIQKYGGHEDQLSHKYEAMDRFRIRALAKILTSGKLDASQTEATLMVLKEKTRIFTQGALKRKRGTKRFKPEHLYIEKAAEALPLTQKILSRLSDVPVSFIEHQREILESFKDRKDPIGEGKRSLLLAFDRGRSFKPFPESENYLSCDYHTLHLEEGCDLECSYCILQAYLTNPVLTLFVNIEEILNNLQKILTQNSQKHFRIGTGQLADSLSLDHITGLTQYLVPFFAKQKNATLELKTKSTVIDHLFDLNPNGNTIVSWSMNSKTVQKHEEHKCASIEERLEAAKRIACTSSYRVGFHFDPIIDHENWEEAYHEVIRNIFTHIPHKRIAWISLGCLRMMPKLKPLMQKRFPKSTLPYAEWISGMDGKLRYFKPRRVEIYQILTNFIRSYNRDVTLYLSMETPEVWQQVLGISATKQGVCEMLDAAALTREESVEEPAEK